jgi:dolichyl-phosphate beta-glucosyltransferase
MKLSIIVPAYNEEKRIALCMLRLVGWLEQQDYTSEIIVVNDGSTDGTADLMRGWRSNITNRPITIRMLDLVHAGKGAAVRAGMLAAVGEYRLMCDVDLSTPIGELDKLLSARQSVYFDVIIGSRAMIRELTHSTPVRRLMSAAFHLLASCVVPGVQDTQCGFKLFTDLAATDIFTRCQVDGFAFDVEVLYLARRMGYPIMEIPVQWRHNPDTRVNFMRDPLMMILDLLRIPLVHPAASQPQEKHSPA